LAAICEHCASIALLLAEMFEAIAARNDSYEDKSVNSPQKVLAHLTEDGCCLLSESSERKALVRHG
jgi:hypothetical protein